MTKIHCLDKERDFFDGRGGGGGGGVKDLYQCITHTIILEIGSNNSDEWFCYNYHNHNNNNPIISKYVPNSIISSPKQRVLQLYPSYVCSKEVTGQCYLHKNNECLM